MENNSTLNQLESELKKNDLSFEQKMELKDKILKMKIETGSQPKPAYTQFKCIGCSG